MALDKQVNPKAVGIDPRDGERAAGSPLIFRLDPSSGVATYAQLVRQVEQALRLGYLRPGDQLPRVREVVSSLAINPNTVLKAYKELEDKELVVGRPGQGTFVIATLEQVDLRKLLTVRRSLFAWLAQASSVGLDEDGIVALFTTALRDYADRGSADGEVGVHRRRRPVGGGQVTA